MKHLNGLFIILTFLVAGVAMAQDTNDLKTQIGWFEARTNVVIIKSYGIVGGIALGEQAVCSGRGGQRAGPGGEGQGERQDSLTQPADDIGHGRTRCV